MSAAGGVGIGPTGSLTTSSWRLHAANATDTIWERPSAAGTWLVFVERYGSPSATAAPIFGNDSPGTPPYSAWCIAETFSSQVLLECSAGGTYRSHILSTAFGSGHGPYVLVGRYNGAALSGAINGAFSSGGAISGALTYPNAADRGPAIGNFYNYTGSARQFNGRVLLAALWDVALTDAEIIEVTKQLRSSRYEAFTQRRIIVPSAASGGTTVAPANGALTFSGKVPTVAQTANQTVAPSKGSLTFTGKVPTVTRTDNQTVAPAKGALAFTGKVPTVTRTDNQTVAPAKGALTFTGYVPTVAQDSGTVIAPSKGALTFTGKVPTVTQTANQIIVPSKGALTFTGKIPTITQTGAVTYARAPRGSGYPGTKPTTTRGGQTNTTRPTMANTRR